MLYAPIFAKLQLMVVASVAGIARRITRLKALLAIFRRASSGFPASANFRGFMEQTYPDRMKKIATARNPPCNRIRKKGRAKGKGTSKELDLLGMPNP